MQKIFTVAGGLILAMLLAAGSANAASRPAYGHFGHGDTTGGSGSGHTLTDAFTPYLQSTAMIRQKLYNHLLQSESFIRFQSLVEYLWLQRTEER
ncbi:MAG: hypothetical protein KJ914_17710 [Gammaproteobacteria bacterium]|nr:hypothetical protein [Gammaproteobacteria bacterium]MBU1724289.1 hypothetical protein [Gammaproteobacteria bacterium]MBU2006283.1 hypothetical protein [Gammaproteobacteria bacterium]